MDRCRGGTAVAAAASIPVNEVEQQTQLRKLGDVLKLDLSQPRVTLEGLTLKRVELLNFLIGAAPPEKIEALVETIGERFRS